MFRFCAVSQSYGGRLFFWGPRRIASTSFFTTGGAGCSAPMATSTAVLGGPAAAMAIPLHPLVQPNWAATPNLS
jgi:hypothetical protein